MSPKRTTARTKSNAGAAQRGPAPSVEPVTELGRLIVRRLAQLGMSRNALAEEYCHRAGVPYTKGQGGYVTMVIGGRRPLSESMAPHWAAALKLRPGTPEFREFMDAAATHRLFTKAGGVRDPKRAKDTLQRTEGLAEENRELRDRLAQLEAELLSGNRPRPTGKS